MSGDNPYYLIELGQVQKVKGLHIVSGVINTSRFRRTAALVLNTGDYTLSDTEPYVTFTDTSADTFGGT